MASKTSKATIKIPRQLYKKLQKQIEGTGFSSVTNFVVYVLRDIASSGRIDQETDLTKNEIESIRKRLQKLGYL